MGAGPPPDLSPAFGRIPPISGRRNEQSPNPTSCENERSRAARWGVFTPGLGGNPPFYENERGPNPTSCENERSRRTRYRLGAIQSARNQHAILQGYDSVHAPGQVGIVGGNQGADPLVADQRQ